MNKRFLRDFFSPFNLLLYFWVLPFLASFMMLSELQDGLSLEATLIIAFSTAILICTSIVPMFLLNGKPMTIRYTNDSLMLIRNGSGLVVLFFLVTLMALYWAAFREGIPLLSYVMEDETDSAMYLIGNNSKLQFIANGIYVAGMTSFFLGINSRARGSKLLFMGLAIFVPILGMLKASKYAIFNPILFYSVLFYYHSRFKKVLINKWSIILLILAGVLMTAMTLIRVGGIESMVGYANLIKFKYSDEIGYPLNEAIALIYGYMSLGFQNFSNYTGYGFDGFHVGQSMFRPFFSIAMQGELVSDLAGEAPFHVGHIISNAAITGTYLRDLYIEGGTLFCFLGSGIYAALVNGVYIKFRKMEGGMWMFIYIVSLFPWTWIFFTNAFSVLTIYLNAFYVFAIFSLIVTCNGRKRLTV